MNFRWSFSENVQKHNGFAYVEFWNAVNFWFLTAKIQWFYTMSVFLIRKIQCFGALSFIFAVKMHAKLHWTSKIAVKHICFGSELPVNFRWTSDELSLNFRGTCVRGTFVEFHEIYGASLFATLLERFAYVFGMKFVPALASIPYNFCLGGRMPCQPHNMANEHARLLPAATCTSQ